ncbi:MAG: type II toxin-antitoxin system VapC family toxin [Candidatus Korarchaeum sp.]
MRIVLDTYGWVEIFIGSEGGERVRRIIEESEEVYTPTIVLAEVARKYLREGFGEDEILERLDVIDYSSEVVPIDKRIALEASKCYLELTERAKREKLRDPSLFDAIVLATARVLDAKLLSGDEHFKGMDEVIWVSESR